MALAAAAVLVFSARGFSQTAGVVSGQVTDSVGAPVLGAQVGITGVPYRAVTGADGVFHLNGVPMGTSQLSVRRLGFSPVSRVVTLTEANSELASVAIRLLHIPAALPTVTVRTDRVKYTGRLAGFYQRLEKRTNGVFITRAQIERQGSRTLQDLLINEPGVTGLRMRNGAMGIRLRGRGCAPLVWLDGMPAAAGELDLSSIVPQTLHGIELYLGSTTAPTRFMLNRQLNSCGTIVLWSRGPDTDPVTGGHKSSVDLNKLVASMTVFTVDQVDSKAEPVSEAMTVNYPPPLFAAAVGGAVIAEYVVDATGRMEPETFGIVSSTNPLFSEAVKDAVEATIFRPAQRKGAAVRQLVQQPFSFVPPKGR